MSLVETIDADLLTAIKSGDNFTKETLRFLKASLKNAEIDSGQPLTDDQAVAIIQKEVKKRVEAEALYVQAGKADLAEKEKQEAELLKKYLPAQMDEAAIKAVINEYLQANPTEISQMGTAMGALSARLKGQADMGLVSRLLREAIQE